MTCNVNDVASCIGSVLAVGLIAACASAPVDSARGAGRH